MRDPTTGFVDQVSIDGVDSDGRGLHAHGVALSRMALQTSHLCVNSLLKWKLACLTGCGEDQDVWSYARFSEFRRSNRRDGAGAAT